MTEDFSTLWQQARFLDDGGYLARHYEQAERYERERLNQEAYSPIASTIKSWSRRYRNLILHGGGSHTKLCCSCDAPMHWSPDDHEDGCEWARWH